MNIFNIFLNDIKSILSGMRDAGDLPKDVSFDNISCEPPRDSSHGDISTNAAMVLAKPAKMNPREIAGKIVEKLSNHDFVEKVGVAGPGFINLSLNKASWINVLSQIINLKDEFGGSDIGGGEKVNIEYVSANPTGPLHIGHARGAVYGDALANLLSKAGYDVTKEFYVNDAGGQIDVLAKSVYLRYKEALGEDIGAIPQGLYPGEYLIPVGKAITDKFGKDLLSKSEDESFPIIKEFAVSSMLDLIKKDLANMGIVHDVFTSEKTLSDGGKIEESFKLLQDKGLIYKGILEAPKGKKPDDWEEREQDLFKATKFGDDVDRALKKSDGSWTYFAADVAYHVDKFQRGFNKMVLVLGADHGGYVKRISSAVSALSDSKAKAIVKICQLVNFLDGGEQVKMSKRAGKFKTVADVVEAVGADVVRFIMLTRKNDALLDFDLKSVTEKSKDNPVFYVQYAHARARSVLRNAKEECPEAVKLMEDYKNSTNCDGGLIENIESDEELELIKFMATWPRMVEAAAEHYEPHRVAFYLQELAALFHALWNKGKEEAVLRFIIPDEVELTAARLLLIDSFAGIISSGLGIMGVKPLEEMR